MATLDATFREPFDEQVAAFRRRLQQLVPTFAWDDLRHAEHERAFVVAGAHKADLLADIAAAVDRAISEGTGIEAFRRDFRDITDRLGWPGKAGHGSERGFAWRTRVIYQTNMRTSYMSGRHAQLVAGDFAFWVYRHSGAREPRPQHLAWDGLALPPDHPFWATHFPPNGWGCGCEVYGARTAAGIRRVGGDPGKALPEGWDATDPRTGAPKGIDKGWDYSVGAGVADLVRATVPKYLQWPTTLAKAFMADVPAPTRDRLARAYRALPEARQEARRFAERVLGERNGAPITSEFHDEPYRTMGLLTTDQAREVGALLGEDVSGFDWSLGRRTIQHVQQEHGDAAGEAGRRQRAIEPSDYAALMALLELPARKRMEDGRLVMEWEQPDRTVHAVFQRLARRRMLELVTMWVSERRAPRH